MGRHHERIHAIARKLIEVVNKGNDEQADQLMFELENARAKMFETLNDIYLL